MYAKLDRERVGCLCKFEYPSRWPPIASQAFAMLILTGEVLAEGGGPGPLGIAHLPREQTLEMQDGAGEDGELPRRLHRGGPRRDSEENRGR